MEPKHVLRGSRVELHDHRAAPVELGGSARLLVEPTLDHRQSEERRRDLVLGPPNGHVQPPQPREEVAGHSVMAGGAVSRTRVGHCCTAAVDAALAPSTSVTQRALRWYSYRMALQAGITALRASRMKTSICISGDARQTRASAHDLQGVSFSSQKRDAWEGRVELLRNAIRPRTLRLLMPRLVAGELGGAAAGTSRPVLGVVNNIASWHLHASPLFSCSAAADAGWPASPSSEERPSRCDSDPSQGGCW